MRNDTNKDLDLLFKEGLEDAAVKAPRSVWKAVSARLDAAAPAAAAAPKRSWLLWGAPAFAFAAAALAAILVVGNTEKTIINSGEEIISVADARPSGPVAMVEETPAQASNIGTRAGFVPKEIQTPDQITVVPTNDSENGLEARSADQIGDDKVVISSEVEDGAEKSQKESTEPWVDPFAEIMAEEAAAAKKTTRRLALKAGGIVGGNDAHILTSRPAFSSGLPSEGIQETTNSIYGIPMSFGLSVRYHFAEKLAVSAGVNWSFLSRTFQGKYKTEEGAFTHNLQYIGIPVAVSYDVIDSKTLLFYCYAGGSAEKAISSKYYIYDLSTSPLLSENVPSLQYGLFGGIGVEFRVSEKVGLYADPGVKYYFPGNQPKSIRTDKPLMFSLEAGLRFNF
ncbi:MAG: PorT family protein [Bacteroidales bacterium]|nr:PorT family protein [Bacteroidales bacterium]